MKREQAVAILAGGKGIRMGGDKPFKMFKDKPLFLWVYSAVQPLGLRVYLSVRTLDQGERLLHLLSRWNLPSNQVVPLQDRVPFEGPLAGVYSLLSQIEEDELLILTCDQPLIKTEVLEDLLRERAPASLFEIEGTVEPFPLKLSRFVLPFLEEFIATSQKRSIKSFLSLLDKRGMLTKIILSGDMRLLFRNVNTPFDLEEITHVQS